ncbi:MAG: phosphatase PAP2 family protein [Acidimicrobiales bacterium]|nr:phosphatase PAP2 family protein [Acidimicrobiales bacterium]
MADPTVDDDHAAVAPVAAVEPVDPVPEMAPSGGLRHQLQELDENVYRAVAISRTPTLDRLMRGVSTAANYSVLWGGIAGVLAVRPGRGRQAAVQGLVAIGLTSFVANQGLKRVVTRNRPARDDAAVPIARHVRMPGSTSFPSGHSASAFAFASAVGDQLPLLSPALHATATAVAYSRVHTGVHYPGDVLAGSLLGLVVGNAVPAVTSWFARHR